MPDTQHPEPITSVWPAITCLCPTYGRFERLRDAVACFLLQDYAGRAELHILNDAYDPIILTDAPGITAHQCLADAHVAVVNERTRYANLGAKRQAALTGAAWTPLVAHWDDDDLYLPWHLSAAVGALRAAKGKMCAKSRCGWWALGRRECWELQGGVHHNTFEGQMVFRRDRALELGGYPPKMSGQAADLMLAFGRAGELALYRPADRDVSYVYRWADGVGHVSACPGHGAQRQMEWLKRNKDFGFDRYGRPQPLIPSGNPALWARARMARQFRNLIQQLRPRLSPDDWQTVRTRLEGALYEAV